MRTASIFTPSLTINAIIIVIMMMIIMIMMIIIITYSLYKTILIFADI